MNLLLGMMMLYSVEIGYQPLNDFSFYNYPDSLYTQSKHNSEFIDMDVRFEKTLKEYHKLSVSGNVNTTITINEMNTFSPVKANYGIGIYYGYKNIEMKFTHNCMHPIYTYVINPSSMSYRFEGGYEELSIKFKGCTKLF